MRRNFCASLHRSVWSTPRPCLETCFSLAGKYFPCLSRDGTSASVGGPAGLFHVHSRPLLTGSPPGRAHHFAPALFAVLRPHLWAGGAPAPCHHDAVRVRHVHRHPAHACEPVDAYV